MNTINHWRAKGYSTYEIAAICFAGPSTVEKWSQKGEMPERAVFLMQMYHGEKTFADWEDYVDGKMNQVREKWRRMNAENSRKTAQRKKGVEV